MLFLLYGNNQNAINQFTDNLLKENTLLTRRSFDVFKSLDLLKKEILQSDSMFGEKNIFFLNNPPKTILKDLEDIFKIKKNINMVLIFIGEDLALKRFGSEVEKLGGTIKEFSIQSSKAVFTLLDAVSFKNLKLALSSLKKLKEDKENILLVLSYLFTRIEKIIATKSGESAGYKFESFCKQFTFVQLTSMLEGLLLLEKKLKSESADGYEELENWLIIYCS